MKTWTTTRAMAVLAATVTLAGCAEVGPDSMIEAAPETFDTERTKRGFAEGWTPRIYLEPLSAERATQVRDNKRLILVLGITADGGWRPIHSYNSPTLDEVRSAQRRMYGPRRERREEAPR